MINHLNFFIKQHSYSFTPSLKTTSKRYSHQWLHGTSAAALSLLKLTKFKLEPTGNLLQKHIVPMTGEQKAGIDFMGINMKHLSGTNLAHAKLAIDYALHVKNINLNVEDFCQFIHRSLQELEYFDHVENEHLSWYKPLLINILKLRQLNEDLYFDRFYERVQSDLPIILKAFNSYKQKLGHLSYALNSQNHDNTLTLDTLENYLRGNFDVEAHWTFLSKDSQGLIKNHFLEQYRHLLTDPLACWHEMQLPHFNPSYLLTAILTVKICDPAFFAQYHYQVDHLLQLVKQSVASYESVMNHIISSKAIPIHFSTTDIFEMLELSNTPLVMESFLCPLVNVKRTNVVGELSAETSLTIGQEIKTLYTTSSSVSLVAGFLENYGLGHQVKVKDFTDLLNPS